MEAEGLFLVCRQAMSSFHTHLFLVTEKSTISMAAWTNRAAISSQELRRPSHSGEEDSYFFSSCKWVEQTHITVLCSAINRIVFLWSSLSQAITACNNNYFCWCCRAQSPSVLSTTLAFQIVPDVFSRRKKGTSTLHKSSDLILQRHLVNIGKWKGYITALEIRNIKNFEKATSPYLVYLRWMWDLTTLTNLWAKPFEILSKGAVFRRYRLITFPVSKLQLPFYFLDTYLIEVSRNSKLKPAAFKTANGNPLCRHPLTTVARSWK